MTPKLGVLVVKYGFALDIFSGQSDEFLADSPNKWRFRAPQHHRPYLQKPLLARQSLRADSFLLPVSAILCLHGLSSFLYLNTGLPSMTQEIATSILSYLTLFNSRCTQLILGAGATRSAGLKNITTKHLALAAQALSFISTLIPHTRVRPTHLGSGSSVSTLMGEFDKARRAYLEHQQSIYDNWWISWLVEPLPMQKQ